jgi:hypothetical protein
MLVDHIEEEGLGKTHLPKRVIISNGMYYLAEPWVVYCFRDWVEEGRCYAL